MVMLLEARRRGGSIVKVANGDLFVSQVCQSHKVAATSKVVERIDDDHVEVVAMDLQREFVLTPEGRRIRDVGEILGVSKRQNVVRVFIVRAFWIGRQLGQLIVRAVRYHGDETMLRRIAVGAVDGGRGSSRSP